MDETFRLDLSNQDKGYIEEVLTGFLQDTRRYSRVLIEIRMRMAMLNKLGIGGNSPTFRDVPIIVTDTGFDGTIEVVLAPQH